ncbi:hypothetical protein MFIFM68171_06606 [Madurella fahalii]|uniref:Uncharacterized protein n=1 Tax=Madurella fahalii TaxID=1157608 RepID=A0ABQ0GF49_9PEZI
MISKDEAQETVLAVAKRLGYTRKEILDKLDPEDRRELEEDLRSTREIAAHSIKRLAKDLYASGARFVFELLQNADDNKFSLARESGTVPFINFKVYSHRIVIDYSEDGFSVEDLKAICDVRSSTKSGSYGYIGAKGIGFKSVFIAAWKVHIQSGPFSFYFEHKKGDRGLGMIAPIWQDPIEELESPLTRMTLHLHDQGSQDELEHLRAMIIEQLDDVRPTCLLFLRKLRRIRVTFFDEQGQPERARELGHSDVVGRSVVLETVLTDGAGNETRENRYYHVTRYTAKSLAPSQNRDVQNTGTTSEVSPTAEVVLAFPLTADRQPLIERQELFAFLPVKESGFKFLIHPDFDTAGNREDISTTSRRNIALRDAIAITFVQAVLEFCEHGDLCYTWSKFLPLSNVTDKFWSKLSNRIKSHFDVHPVLRSRHRSHLRKIQDVVVLAISDQDEHGEPPFDDRNADPYLSGRYRPEVFEHLRCTASTIRHPKCSWNSCVMTSLARRQR